MYLHHDAGCRAAGCVRISGIHDYGFGSSCKLEDVTGSAASRISIKRHVRLWDIGGGQKGQVHENLTANNGPIPRADRNRSLQDAGVSLKIENEDLIMGRGS